jgi:hypothetical protein
LETYGRIQSPEPRSEIVSRSLPQP